MPFEQEPSPENETSPWYVLGWSLGWIILGAAAASQLGKVAGGERGPVAFIAGIAMVLAGAAAFGLVSRAIVRQMKPAAAMPIIAASVAGVCVSGWLMYHAHGNDTRVDTAIAACAYFFVSFIAACATGVLCRRTREQEARRNQRRKLLSEQRRERERLNELEGANDRYREVRAPLGDYLHVVADNERPLRKNQASS